MVAITQNIENFTSTNALNPIALYNPSTIYATNNLVREMDRVYKSITSGNLGHYPPNNLYEHWFDWDVSNEHAMLDFIEETITNFAGDGVVVFERGANEAIAIGNFLASVVTIEYLDVLDAVVYTEVYEFPFLGARIDAYSYIYADFVSIQTQTIYKPIKRIGINIRVTFSRSTRSTFCGIFTAGRVIDLGETLDTVNLTNKIIGFDNKRNATFSTLVDNASLNLVLEFGQSNKDVPMLFVIDPSETTKHQSLAIIGKITNISGVANNFEKNQISWEITQN
jgi:hypothetical protein